MSKGAGMATAQRKRTDAQGALRTDPAGSRLSRVLASRSVAALATSLLLYCSFFPLNWGWLGWVALVPLLGLVRRPEQKGVYRSAWLCGLAFAVPALQWIRLASLPMYATWAGLSVFISLHFLLFAWITRRLLVVRLPLLLVAPVVWVALEYARAHVGIGFAWYYLGHTQHEFLPVIQIADVIGAYGVSFLVMMANVVLFHWLRWLFGYDERRASRPPWIASTSVVSLLAGTLAYGYWRLDQNDFEEGPRLALLQGNLPQDIRADPNEEDTAREHFRRLAREAATARPDLIVWSETSYILSPETPLHLDLSSLGTTAQLLGINTAIWDGERKRLYNSALLFDDRARPIDRYDKMYRVPFGEYVPWEDALPFMRWLTPYENDYSIQAGERRTVFPVPGTPYRFAALICYEDTVPHLPRKFMGVEGKWDFRQPYRGPDFFINMSNDGWFKGSEEHEQHLVAARFRAVECRRAVARAVNMGVSGVIDGNGRLVALPGPTLSQSKARTAVVVANVPIDRRESLYVRWGDVLPLGCWLLTGAALLFSAVQWWRGK